MQELKGFYDIQKMLLEPRHLFHCAEMMGSSINDQGEKLIDEKARKQYQKKILDLQNDIQEAETGSDYLQAGKTSGRIRPAGRAFIAVAGTERKNPGSRRHY